MDRKKSIITKWILDFLEIESGRLPSVTIVTPVFNILKSERESQLIQCVESVFCQNYSGNIEHIVIDGGSLDGTKELLVKLREKYKIKYISEPDRGIYDAMNKGLNLSAGEFVAFLNSDDSYCERDSIASSIKRILHEKADVSYANSYVINHISGEKRFFWDGDLDTIPLGKFPNHQTIFAKKADLIALGGFNTKYKSIADNDLMLRLLLENKKFIKCNKTIVHFRDGGFSSSLDSDLKEENRIFHIFAFERLTKINLSKYGIIEINQVYCLDKDKLLSIEPYLEPRSRFELYRAYFGHPRENWIPVAGNKLITDVEGRVILKKFSIMKFIKYRILSKITFGGLRKRYKSKYNLQKKIYNFIKKQ